MKKESCLVKQCCRSSDPRIWKMHIPKIARACIPVPGIGFRNFFCASIGFSSSTITEKPLLFGSEGILQFDWRNTMEIYRTHQVRKPMCEQNRAGRGVNRKNTPTHSNARQQKIRDCKNIPQTMVKTRRRKKVLLLRDLFGGSMLAVPTLLRKDFHRVSL